MKDLLLIYFSIGSAIARKQLWHSGKIARIAARDEIDERAATRETGMWRT